MTYLRLVYHVRRHRIALQAGNRANSSLSRIVLDAKGEQDVSVTIVGLAVDIVANRTKDAHVVHDDAIEPRDGLRTEAPGSKTRRLDKDDDLDLTFELINGGSVLGLGQCKIVRVDERGLEGSAVEDVLTFTGIANIIKVKVDTTRVGDDATVEALILRKSQQVPWHATDSTYVSQLPTNSSKLIVHVSTRRGHLRVRHDLDETRDEDGGILLGVKLVDEDAVSMWLRVKADVLDAIDGDGRDHGLGGGLDSWLHGGEMLGGRDMLDDIGSLDGRARLDDWQTNGRATKLDDRLPSDGGRGSRLWGGLGNRLFAFGDGGLGGLAGRLGRV